MRSSARKNTPCCGKINKPQPPGGLTLRAVFGGVPPLAMTSLRPWQSTHTVGGHPVRWWVGVEGGRRSRPFSPQTFQCAGRAKPAPWLSQRESWHGVAVTERVPGKNHGTFPKLATAYTLSGSPLARQLPHRGSQGRLRRQFSPQTFRCAGRAKPAPWLSLWESWHGVAVTERVPGSNQRTNAQTCHCLSPLSLASLASSPIGGAKGGCAAGASTTRHRTG